MSDKRIKISSIQIKNFRSMRNETIKPRDFNIFVGLNDVGKSNVLKALNLFFNGQTDYNTIFSFHRDFTYLFPSTSHSTKEIKITIKFEIPDTYSESGEYTWSKVWRTNGYFDENIINGDGTKPNSKSRVPSAIRRIKYRYVPAVKSTDYYKTLLEDLYTAVSSSLNNPLQESTNEFSNVLKDYTKELSVNINSRINLSSFLSIPSNLNDIFRALIFETYSTMETVHVPLTARGDGIQARHIPIILEYIAQEDQKSRNKGSMKVCTIWGFEEPENGLELLKSFKLADEFEDYSKNIQIFTTTHSPAFYMKKSNESAQIFFVSKKVDGETSISTDKHAQQIAENMGLMPLVAPFIEEQSIRLEQAEQIYRENILTDVPTIMVEGETDIKYLEIGIGQHSPLLQELIESHNLRIICKNDGAGTTQLIDWALAWLYTGFKSKLLILFDKDSAGIKAKNSIESNEAFRSKQNSSSIRLQYIEPSDIIIDLIQKHIKINYEIEHLLSIGFWKKIKQKGLEHLRSDEELREMFAGLVPINRTLENVMDELILDSEVRDTIVTFEPKLLKKKQIVQLLERENDKLSATAGFTRTIRKIESYFC